MRRLHRYRDERIMLSPIRESRTESENNEPALAWKMHRFGRIERKALMLRMIEIASQISGVFAKRPSTNDSPWLLSGL
jgi:hypothetical protein